MGIFSKIKSLFVKKRLDDAALDAMLDALIMADIAPDIAADSVKKLRAKFRPDDDTDEAEIKLALMEILRPYADRLAAASALWTAGGGMRVVLVIGVNGAGKTTTIGKLAKQWTDLGKRVVIGSCDTFRAAAGEQLEVWARRAGATLAARDQESGTGCDPASVAYQAVQRGLADSADIVVLDTAGRLHNRSDLMDELSKIIRVVRKILPDAPHEVLLVLDGMTGQNAVAQIEYFNKTAPLTGLIVTKMDSTGKGGFLISYSANHSGKEVRPLPIAAIGYGEKISDLRLFDADEYLRKLLDISDQ